MAQSRIVISHTSALLLHRAKRLGLIGSKARLPIRTVDDVITWSAALGVSLPIDVCVRRPEDRIGASWARNHVTQSFGEIPVEPISPSLGIVCAANALCQATAKVGNVPPLLMAYEMCGTYALDPSHPDGFRGRLQPILTTREIGQALLSDPGSPASRKAIATRQLTRAVIDGAASPAEAKLCLAMCLPRLSGGFGLPKPELNSELRVTGLAQSLTSKRTIIPDALWRWAKLILEYQGSYHSGQSRIESDAGRDNALLSMGYRVIHVTRRQVMSYELYQGLMDSLRVSLGIRASIPSSRMLERRYELWRTLYRKG